MTYVLSDYKRPLYDGAGGKAMFYVLSVFIGVMIAVMVFVNGDLTVA